MANTNTLKFLKFVLIAFLPMAKIAAGEETNSASAASGETGAVHGVQLFLTFPKTTFTNGEHIVAWAVLTNQTESPMNVRPSYIWSNLTLAITNADNVLVTPINNEPEGGSAVYSILLPPHSCDSNSVAIGRFYDLKPGVYRIYAKRDMALWRPWWKAILTSDVVTITVVEAPKAKIADGEETNSTSAASGETGAVHGVQFFLTFPKTTYTNGEHIVAWAVLTNQTESAMGVSPSYIWHNLTLAVTNADNIPVARIYDKSEGTMPSVVSSILLPPHSCDSNSVSIGRFYDLKPGVYRIYAKRDMALRPPWGKSILTSDVVTITVVEAPKK